MTRVLLLAIVCLAVLVAVVRSLPPPLSADSAPEAGLADPGSPFAPWDGVWEGTFRTYAPDGALESAIEVRQEYTTVSPTEQEVVIVDRLADGTERRSRGRNSIDAEGRIECRVWDAQGTMKRLTGARHGRAILWHHADPRAGLSETFREEILSTASGDLYTIDGAGVYGGDARRLLLFEGRYRRVAGAGR